MIIIRVNGGIGNQLFIYALFQTLKVKIAEVKIDTNYINSRYSARTYVLDKIDDQIHENVASVEEVESITGKYSRLIYRFKRKFFPRIFNILVEKDFNYEKNIDSILTLSSETNIYLDGYWQDFRYFLKKDSEIKSTIMSGLISQFNRNKYSNLVLEKIGSSNSVSLHIRLGDKVNSKFHVGTKIEYLNLAVNYISERVENPIFIVFSDDIIQAEYLVKEIGINYITFDSIDSDLDELYLMSCCKHKIIGPSTFSWWAAYLGRAQNGIVIYPQTYNQLSKAITNKSLFLEEWIKL